MTGASIQVASEMLQNSTERTVTLAGNAESITKCIYQICSVMIEVCVCEIEIYGFIEICSDLNNLII